MPLILLGGITNQETMDRAIAEGFEFVAMAQRLLAKPDLVLVNQITANSNQHQARSAYMQLQPAPCSPISTSASAASSPRHPDTLCIRLAGCSHPHFRPAGSATPPVNFHQTLQLANTGSATATQPKHHQAT